MSKHTSIIVVAVLYCSFTFFFFVCLDKGVIFLNTFACARAPVSVVILLSEEAGTFGGDVTYMSRVHVLYLLPSAL